MLSRLVFFCGGLMMFWGDGLVANTALIGTPSIQKRMQKAYDDAKALVLALPQPHINRDDNTSDTKEPSMHDEVKADKSDAKCFTAIDLTKDAIPCEKTKIGSSHNNVDGTTTTQATEASDKILVFVSLSMPKESLKQLAHDALTHNAVLILRGLKDNSFKETVAFLKTIGQGSDDADMTGFEINPIFFETYGISHVPVFIHVKKDQEKARLSGNVTLPFAHKKFMESDIKDKP